MKEIKLEMPFTYRQVFLTFSRQVIREQVYVRYQLAKIWILVERNGKNSLQK